MSESTPESLRDEHHFATPGEIDELLRWQFGKAERLAKRGRLPHYRLPDASIVFRIDEITEVIIKVEAPVLEPDTQIVNRTPIVPPSE
jgi:hypothetical protein